MSNNRDIHDTCHDCGNNVPCQYTAQIEQGVIVCIACHYDRLGITDGGRSFFRCPSVEWN